MSTHCFYHSADLDGHCSGAIVKHFVPEAIMHPINYGDAFPWDQIEPEDTVYMVDFCLQPAGDMDRLCDICHVVWIDHHKTALECMAHRIINGYQEVGRAGCELTWLWCRDVGKFTDWTIPLAVTLLGRYHVWDHSDPRTLPFQYRMRMEDTDPLKGEGAIEVWQELFAEKHGTDFSKMKASKRIFEMVTEGSLLLRYEEQQNVKVCRAYAFETELVVNHEGFGLFKTFPEKFKAICLNRGMTNSKVFDSVYDPEKHHLMITFCRLPLHKQTKGCWTVSLYSTRDDIDCGAIAKTFGGGGHKGAAGFQCDNLPFGIGRGEI